MDRAEAEAVFLQELDAIDALIGSISRRHGLDPDDEDSFASYARYHILADDYAVIRRFAGASSLKTYLRTVLARCFLDYRNQRWGKWRPCAAARKLGPTGVLLDTLINRDRLPRDQAVQVLLGRSDVEESEAALRAIAARLPRRTKRAVSSLDEADSAHTLTMVDVPAQGWEGEDQRMEASSALQEAIEELPSQMQVVFKLMYWEGMSVASAARILGLEQKALYRFIKRDLKHLRKSLERRGIDREWIQEVIDP